MTPVFADENHSSSFIHGGSFPARIKDLRGQRKSNSFSVKVADVSRKVPERHFSCTTIENPSLLSLYREISSAPSVEERNAAAEAYRCASWRKLGSVLKLQRWFRMRGAMLHVKRETQTRIALRQFQYETECAETIQRQYRNWRIRRKILRELTCTL